MKEAIIIDLDGFYVEPELVPISAYGITPIYELPEPVESEEESDEEQEQDQPEPILIGYRVSVSVPQGLYKPKYDIPAWENAIEQYDLDYADYLSALSQYDEESEEDKPNPPATVNLQSFWIEGLTQDELDEIYNRPIPKSTEQKLQEVNNEIGVLSGSVLTNEIAILDTMEAIAQVYEEKELQLAQKEEDILNAMEAITELYEQMLLLQG